MFDVLKKSPMEIVLKFDWNFNYKTRTKDFVEFE